MFAKLKAALVAVMFASIMPQDLAWADHVALDPAYVAAMNTQGPVVLGLASQAALSVSATNTVNILDQLNERRRGAPSSETIERAWVSGAYNHDDWSNFALAGVGAKRDGWRGTLGGEYAFLPQLVVGLAAGYGEQSAESDTWLSMDASGYSGTIYGRFAAQRYFLQAGYSYGEIEVADIRRVGALGTNYLGNTRGQTHSYFVQAGYMLAMGPMSLGPVFGYSGDYARLKAYTETSVCSASNITLPTNKLYSSVVSIGLEVNGTKWPLKPHFSVSYNGQLEEKTRPVTLRLATSTEPVGTSAAVIRPVNEDFVAFGAGLQGTFDVVQWNFGYGAELGTDDRFSQSIRAGLTIPL